VGFFYPDLIGSELFDIDDGTTSWPQWGWEADIRDSIHGCRTAFWKRIDLLCIHAEVVNVNFIL
jgi:hypothetical protein